MGDENRLRNTSGGNNSSVFSVAESAGCVFGRTLVRQLPGEDVEGWEPCHPCFARPLCRLDCAVELVAVQCVGIPMVIGLVPRVLEWWRGGRDVGWRGRGRAGAGSRCWLWTVFVSRWWWSDWIGCGQWWWWWGWEPVGTPAVMVESVVAACAAVASCMGEDGGPDVCGVRG